MAALYFLGHCGTIPIVGLGHGRYFTDPLAQTSLFALGRNSDLPDHATKIRFAKPIFVENIGESETNPNANGGVETTGRFVRDMLSRGHIIHCAFGRWRITGSRNIDSS